MRESYKDIFTELLLADDTRVGFHRQDNGLLVWQGAYLTRSAETLLPWRAVANALNDLIEQHELIATIDPKKLPQVVEQLSFELPDGSPPSAEDDRLEKVDFLTPEKQENVIRSALPCPLQSTMPRRWMTAALSQTRKSTWLWQRAAILRTANSAFISSSQPRRATTPLF